MLSHTPPAEILVQIVVNDRPMAQLLCSPNDLQALAYGWLFTQGVIDLPGEITSLRACHESGVIRVGLRHDREARIEGFRTVLSSGCGGGVINMERYLSVLPELSSDFSAEHAAMESIMTETYDRFRNPSARWEGTHCAAISHTDESAKMLMASDIGRHNAVDKVIGMGLLADWDFGRSILATSGRLSSDMVLKAHRAGVPIVISQHSVTSMAIEIARAARIALVSRFGRRDEDVFGERRRIIPTVYAE